jgi:hypothetical protein
MLIDTYCGEMKTRAHRRQEFFTAELLKATTRPVLRVTEQSVQCPRSRVLFLRGGGEKKKHGGAMVTTATTVGMNLDIVALK